MFVHSFYNFFSFYGNVKKYNTYSRRMNNPFEMKHRISINKFPILQLKKSETNFFCCFSFNDQVLFSCSAGSSGLVKKERRRKHAAYVVGMHFCKFIRYYYKTKKNFSAFRNIIVLLRAPISFFKLFIKSFRSFYLNIFSSFSSDYQAKINTIQHRFVLFRRIFFLKYNTLIRSIRDMNVSRISFFCSLSFYLINRLLLSVFHCSFSFFFKSYFISTPEHLYSKQNLCLFSFSRYFTLLKKQQTLFCSDISNPPKALIFNYFHQFVDVFSYVRKINNESFTFLHTKNFFFYSFLQHYFFLRDDFFSYYFDYTFFLSSSYNISDECSPFFNNILSQNISLYIGSVSSFVSMLNFDFFSSFHFSLLRNLNTFSFFLKYAYRENYFFFFSTQMFLKFSYFSSYLFKQKYNVYFFLFINRLFFSFLFFYYHKSISFSYDILFFFRFFLTRFFSFSFFKILDLFYSDNFVLTLSNKFNFVNFPFF